MGISDLYMSVGQKRNISHFANIVRIATSDNIVTIEEMELLLSIAKNFGIGNYKFNEIINNPEKFPTIAHLECEERIERLYDLVKMIKADHIVADEEVACLRRIATGLAFPIKRVDEIVEKAIKIDVDSSSFESFQKELMELIRSV